MSNKISYIIKRTCLDKRQLSKLNADIAIESYAKKKIVMYYYKCPFCSSYHLTKKERVDEWLTVIGGNKTWHVMRCVIEWL